MALYIFLYPTIATWSIEKFSEHPCHLSTVDGSPLVCSICVLYSFNEKLVDKQLLVFTRRRNKQISKITVIRVNN